jgi:DNA-binding SARP family transcriptional activator
MSAINVTLFGAPQMERDGHSLNVDTRKALALLAFLVVPARGVAPQPHTRDVIAALLWPDLDQARARAALRRTLSPLLKALGADILEVSRETLQVAAEAAIAVDVLAFRGLLAEAARQEETAGPFCPACLEWWEAAARLYRDDFMAGFTLRDSPEFDEWQYYTAEGLRRELDAVLEKLVAGYTALGQLDKALASARRWLALDPLREEAHRTLMQLYAWGEQREAALRQYQACVRVLERELGVAPLAETTALYEAIKANRLGSPPAAVTPAPVVVEAVEMEPAGTPAPYPLVGRENERAALERAYEQARRGGVFAVLDGEVGIGKTRLAEEVLAGLRARGAAVVAVRCYPEEAELAYGPWVEALRATVGLLAGGERLWIVAPQRLSEAARLVPELAQLRADLPAAGPLDDPGAQSRFFAGVTHTLGALARDGVPAVLFFDDLQWADAASLDLLTFLVRRLHEHNLLLLAAAASGDGEPERRLQRLIAGLEPGTAAQVVSLRRLPAEAVAEMVETVCGEETDAAALGAQLYEESEGLPLFVVAYLAAAGDGSGEAVAWLPPTVRQLLLARLQGAPDAAQQLLQAAAVIGRRFEFDTVRAASGRSDEEVVAALEALLERGLIEERSERGSVVYDFTHEKLRVLAYEEMSLARQRLLHRRAAEALWQQASARDREALAGRVAQHYQRAGQPAEAAAFYRRAGEHARSLFANREALGHFETALELGVLDAAETVAVHEAIGDLQTMQGEYGAAVGSYEAGLALAGGRGAGLARARLQQRLGRVAERRGEWAQADAHYGAALDALEGEPAVEAVAKLRAHTVADRSRAAQAAGQAETARALADEALRLAQEAGDAVALARAHNICGLVARQAGDRERAVHHLEQSLVLARAEADPSAEVAALNNLALAIGEPERALALLQDALALCEAQGDRHREAALHSNLADLLHETGAEEQAMAHLKASAAIYRDIGKQGAAWQPEIWKLMAW